MTEWQDVRTWEDLRTALGVDSEPSSNGAGPDDGEDDAPFALELDDFIAARSELPPALIGDEDDVLLSVAGFLILGGRGGKGKTTLALDGAFHGVSGIDWLGFPIPRPMNVLILENEGTREMFRRKLERKLRNWPQPIRGRLFVYTWDWGGFDVRDDEKRERLKRFVSENEIDLVIADPLDSCGLAGVGSPEDTRAFMDFCKVVGLHRSVAMWFLHHPRKEKTDDELEDLSGAWGGKPDTVLMLSLLAGDRSRLAIPKMRHGKRGKGPTLILKFDVETEGFERIAEEGEERDYGDEIAELLADGKWRIVEEIQAGISASRPKVKAALEADERFVSKPGGEVGRSASATVWGLA
jgi:hypothetical protein